jgi:hypothetical protein
MEKNPYSLTKAIFPNQRGEFYLKKFQTNISIPDELKEALFVLTDR